VKLGVGLPGDNGEFFGRNALLVLLGGAVESNRPLIVALGIHSASPYYDTTSAFASDAQRVLDGYAKGAITLGAPFLSLTKQSIVDYARRHRVPLRLTYSCERKNAPACGKCPSCGDRGGFGVD
jgi:7-cyano-7-deazaguanine synthase